MAATKRGGKKKSAKKTASKKVKAARAAKPAKRGKAVAKPPKKKAAPKRAAPRAVAGTEVKQAASAPARIAVDKAYEALVSHLKGVAVLESVSRTIGWDQETMMPAKAANLRAEQMQLLAGMMHDQRTDPLVGELLDAAGDDKSLKGDKVAEANLREIKRDYDQATKLPKALVEEIARCSSLGMDAWKDAKKNSDFKTFLPWLEKTVELNRKKAECLGLPEGGKEHYDALLDIYEPGMTAAKTEAIFKPFRDQLVPLIRKVTELRSIPSDRPARAMTPIEDQKKFATLICEKIGFDFQAGRIDESAHPFCEGVGPGDTRMTNRYRPDGWADALGTAMHESGHALYEQGLPKQDRFGQPLAEAISLGIHESQSRMWENQVGRSLAFWKWAITQAHKSFGAALMAYSAEDVYKAVNLVKPNLIRVESDELTYNLHIMLRFDLERAMISGNLSPRDLPGVWNDRIYKDLGLQVPDDRRGCLQDVHWSMGALGYFPTYTFGNLYAAQLWESMEKDIKNRDEKMAAGEFSPILSWLRDNIHRHGRQFSAEELCKKITGKPLSHDPLMRHLEKKVNAVYGV